MKEEIISLETAKLANEKGFNYPGFMMFDMMGNINLPTQPLLQRWLREVYNIHINVMNQVDHWELMITRRNPYSGSLGLSELESRCFETYEETLEIGLLEVLKLISK